MNSKKLALYIVAPTLAIATLTAVTLSNVESPISETGASAQERNIVLNVSNNDLFSGITGNASGISNTPTGDTMTFSTKYVTPSQEDYDGALGDHTAASDYTIHASATSYWCYITHDKPFNDLRSVATSYSPEDGSRIETFALYASDEPFTSFPDDGDKVNRVSYHSSGYDFPVGEGKHYFALAYKGYSNKSTDYYIDISQITIKYNC